MNTKLLEDIRDVCAEIVSALRTVPTIKTVRVSTAKGAIEILTDGEKLEVKEIVEGQGKFAPAALFVRISEDGNLILQWNDDAYITIDSSNRILFFAEGVASCYADSTGIHDGAAPP